MSRGASAMVSLILCVAAIGVVALAAPGPRHRETYAITQAFDDGSYAVLEGVLTAPAGPRP